MFNLLLKGALDGELDGCCAALSGEWLEALEVGGLRIMFRRDDAFLIGRSGEDGFVEISCIVGMGARSEVTGSW
jgi:hypothetical protein